MNSVLLPTGLLPSQLPHSNSLCRSALLCAERCLLHRSPLRRLYFPHLQPCRGSRLRRLPPRRLLCCPSAGDRRRSQLEYLDRLQSLAMSLAAAFHAHPSEPHDQTAWPEPSRHLPWLARLLASRAPPAWCCWGSQLFRRLLPPRLSARRLRHPASPF